MQKSASYSILFAGFEHTTVYKLDPARGELHWSLDLTRPHDIKSSEGRWELYGAEGGQATLVRYIASMESGRSVPQLVEEMLVTKSLEQLFEGLRGEIERRSSRRILRVQRPL